VFLKYSFLRPGLDHMGNGDPVVSYYGFYNDGSHWGQVTEIRWSVFSSAICLKVPTPNQAEFASFAGTNTALRAFQVQSIEEHCLILQMASILNVVIE
jgi:hypothetical protein